MYNLFQSMVMVTDLEAAEVAAAASAATVGVQVEAATVGVTTTARAVAQYCIPPGSLEVAACGK